MKLPKLPFLNKKLEEEYYLALVLRDEKVSALIFKEQAGKITIVSKRDEDLTGTLEETPLDELVSILDKVISHAETRLPADIEIKNTIFGVKDSWVNEKKINKDYLLKLKHACSELDLTPIGFIVLPEAIAHLIRQEEGAPATALITEVGKFGVSVSLFKAGKLIETKTKSITSSPMHAVDEVLKEFENVEILPSRIILFHATSDRTDAEKDELSQQFIAHSWSKSLPFLQIPQISILPHGFDGKAIIAGAATQLGFEFTNNPDDLKNSEIIEVDTKKSRRTHKTKYEDANQAYEDNEPDTKSEDINADAFGFILDKDITALPAHLKDESNKTRELDDGFDNEYKSSVKPDALTKDEIIKETDDENISMKNPGTSFFSFFTPVFSKFKPRSFSPLMKKKWAFFIPPVFILLLIAFLLFYFFSLKATVTLIVSPKEVEETQRITLSTKSQNNFTENIIAAKELTVAIEGNNETQATGEKEVGDKAKGTVTLYNSDASRKTLKEGTEITSEKGLVFTLDKEISIASASGDIFTGIKSGTTQAAVTAGKIGTEYNLPSNSKFSIQGTDVVAAKNESAFSGGTKKKVTVVTQKDVERLEEELPKSLTEKARTDLKKKLGGNEELLSGFTKITLTKTSLDNEIDKEAKTVKLTGTVNFSSIAYDKDDLLQFAQESIRERYTKEELNRENIDTKLSGIKDASDTELTAVAAINAGLLPKIDVEDMKSKLTGKSFTEAKNIAKNTSVQIKDTQITLSPNLPFLPQMLPRLSKNINVVVSPSL